MRRAPIQVLGLHPTSRGFGWILLEDTRSFLDWGTVDAVSDDPNTHALNRFAYLLNKMCPDVVAMEARNDAIAHRSRRIRGLCLAIVAHVQSKNIVVYHCTRSQIANSRLLKGARTRHQVASAVADCLSALRPHLPKPRPLWIGEQSGMRVFCAAACALTYLDEITSPATVPLPLC